MDRLKQFLLSVVLSTLALDAAIGADNGRMRFDGAAYPKPRADVPAAFFDSGYIPRLKVILEPKEYDALKKEPRKYTRCSVLENETTLYTNVAVHLKGAYGSFRQIDDRPALTLNFDKYQRGQRFHGLDKVNLNNSVQDGTLCHEFVGSCLFRAAGLAAARVSHARVELNNRMLGVYVLMEGLDSSFCERNFGNGHGTFYDGSFKQITDDLPYAAHNKRTDRSDLKALKAALEEKDPGKRRQRIDAVLDVEQFLNLMVMEAMVCHWDGYCNANNNYRVYHNPATDKLVVIAHGMDQIIGDPNYALITPNAVVARVLTESAEDKRQYYQRFQRLRQAVYKEDALTNAVMGIAARLKPVFETFDANAGRNQAGGAADLCRRILARGVNLDRLLATALGKPWEPKPLTGWQARTAEGAPAFDEFKEGDKSRLRIRTGDKPVVGSWRVRVTVPQGRYVFEARVRTVDVPQSNDPQQGAGLRISGGQRRAGITGSTDWQKVEYEINADQGVTDVELVCELRAARGEAWFDLESLKLVRK